MGGDGAPNLVGGQRGALLVGLRQNDRKLVDAIGYDKIGQPQLPAQNAADLVSPAVRGLCS